MLEGAPMVSTFLHEQVLTSAGAWEDNTIQGHGSHILTLNSSWDFDIDGDVCHVARQSKA
jgi:hypothetical protein